MISVIVLEIFYIFVNIVIVDDYKGSYLVVDYLLFLYYKKIVIIIENVKSNYVCLDVF